MNAPIRPPGTGPQQAATALQELSRALLALTGLAQGNRPHALLADAMQVLRGLVPFDAAWWGEVSQGSAGDAPRTWLHGSIGLSRGFADEWNQLAVADDFARHSMQRLGTVIREHEAPVTHADAQTLIAFSERHGLRRCMATTVELPRSGLLFFISLYRPETQPPFSDAQALLLGEFTRHLLCHWSHALQRWAPGSAQHLWDSYALAEPGGALLFAGLRMGQALAEAYPDWPGDALPDDLRQSAARLPCTVAPAAGRHRFRLEACGPLVAVSLPSRGAGSPLAPREMSAATLYAHGQSYKDIAATLGLSPATVRTYLRSAYAALGVRNKTELVAALRRG